MVERRVQWQESVWCSSQSLFRYYQKLRRCSDAQPSRKKKQQQQTATATVATTASTATTTASAAATAATATATATVTTSTSATATATATTATTTTAAIVAVEAAVVAVATVAVDTPQEVQSLNFHVSISDVQRTFSPANFFDELLGGSAKPSSGLQ